MMRVPVASLAVSRIALGGNIFGRFCDAKATADILGAASHAGLNLVDTSDTYSDGESERFLGAALRNSRSNWIVATKAGIRSDESPVGLGRRDNIRRKVEGSLRRLGIPCIDIYQMHHFDKATPLEETLAALDELRSEGKIRYAAVSNYSCDQLAVAIDVSARAHIERIRSVQNHFNMFKRDGESTWLPLCVEYDVAVLVYGALARGILTDKYADGKLPKDSRASESQSIRSDLTPEVLDTVSRLRAVAHDLGVKIGQLAVAWTLSRPGITSLVLGIRSPEQLEDHVRALDFRITSQMLQAVDEVLGPIDRFSNLGMGSHIPA
jgi:aryl-alcohol dehydrogenase-like predicted oxidoreductase